MARTILMRADESLGVILERIRKDIAVDMKKRYNLQEIVIPGTLASQVLASKYKGQKFLNFNIRKISLNKGILELL